MMIVELLAMSRENVPYAMCSEESDQPAHLVMAVVYRDS